MYKLILSLFALSAQCAISGTGNASYDTNPDGYGKCSFPAGYSTYFTGVGPSVFAGSASCGACIQVTNPKTNKSVIVRVSDQCAGCGAGDLNLNKPAFEQIGDPFDGRIPVTWKEVKCDNTPGNLVYQWWAGSNRWWAAVQIRNHAQAITKFEVFDGTQWKQMTRREDNYFVVSGVGAGPLKVKLTGTDDKTVEDAAVPILEAGGPVNSGGQL